MPHARRDIYYWKCDRPAAFHGTSERRASAMVHDALQDELRTHFSDPALSIQPAQGQGNHLTYHARIDGQAVFVRVEDGPEHDDYIEVESALLDRVRSTGVPVPNVMACDATRARVPFAWQVLETIPHPDLNHWQKMGVLDLPQVAEAMGQSVATWQQIVPGGFGPFNIDVLRTTKELAGYHGSYRDYFHCRLASHLCFLRDRAFLSADQTRVIEAAVRECDSLLSLPAGVLVHKDLALWNVLGTPHSPVAYIDFDDAIAGDPMDDLSLLGCFHDGATLLHAVAGYQRMARLPEDAQRRFWLHLLRNMLVKSIIRLGAGYFDRGDGFFLIGSGRSGADLRSFTLERLFAAVAGLRENRPMSQL